MAKYSFNCNFLWSILMTFLLWKMTKNHLSQFFQLSMTFVSFRHLALIRRQESDCFRLLIIEKTIEDAATFSPGKVGFQIGQRICVERNIWHSFRIRETRLTPVSHFAVHWLWHWEVWPRCFAEHCYCWTSYELISCYFEISV